MPSLGPLPTPPHSSGCLLYKGSFCWAPLPSKAPTLSAHARSFPCARRDGNRWDPHALAPGPRLRL